MEPSNSVDLIYACRHGAYSADVFVNIKGIGVGVSRALSECAEAACEYANICCIYMEILIEEYVI